jgi:hypothetical protein
MPKAKTPPTTKSTKSAKSNATPRRARQAPAALSFPRKVILQTPLQEAIAERAYQLFVEAGGQHGHDIDHWLMAEQELRGGDRSAREAS